MNLCPSPFVDLSSYPANGGYLEGRICQKLTDDLSCCLTCPSYEWFYPESYAALSIAASWIAVASLIGGALLILSWAALPKEKTARHYLSICLTIGICFMSLGFVVPLGARNDPCHDGITPNDQTTDIVCGASGAFLIGGGWAAVMWAFLRSFSLHMQICWRQNVGTAFMWFSHAAGWGVPIIALALAFAFTGVSYRFGPTCHINHDNSLATLWIPLLIFAGLTVIMTFATLGYCIKVYLNAMGLSPPSEESSLPYTNSARTMTPLQAYRRVRRVIFLQWRGIAIVLIIIADVVFFSVVLVFQDNILQRFSKDPEIGEGWVNCMIRSGGDKTQCFDETHDLVVKEATVGAVLVLLASNGVWAIFLLGRLSMLQGWYELLKSPFARDNKEFVSVDASQDINKDKRAYMMLDWEKSSAVTVTSPVRSPSNKGERRTPDYFSQSGRHSHQRTASYSSQPGRHLSWNAEEGYTPQRIGGRNPLGMNTIHDEP